MYANSSLVCCQDDVCGFWLRNLVPGGVDRPIFQGLQCYTEIVTLHIQYQNSQREVPANPQGLTAVRWGTLTLFLARQPPGTIMDVIIRYDAKIS
jgi:hypothetical protein